MGQLYYITVPEWQDFLQSVAGKWNIFAPIREGEILSYQKLSDDNLSKIELDSYRPTQPIKSFLFLFYEQITNITKFPNLRGAVVLGVKACDLNSLQLYDKMFLEGEFVEPFYKRRRQDLIIIGSDCQQPLDTCFCTIVNGKPYPEDFSDINLSLLNTGAIVEVSSEAGEEFIKSKKNFFKKLVDRNILVKREAKRMASIEKLAQANAAFGIKTPFLDLLRQKYESPVWERFAETCVTCGACTQICPDCYCFLIEEAGDKKENGFTKFRYWDSCQYTGFARVAGGANPRKKLYQRLRHRYLHKFDYIRENFGLDGCTGCGRCIQACQGKIDIRKVLSDLKNA